MPVLLCVDDDPRKGGDGVWIPNWFQIHVAASRLFEYGVGGKPNDLSLNGLKLRGEWLGWVRYPEEPDDDGVTGWAAKKKFFYYRLYLQR